MSVLPSGPRLRVLLFDAVVRLEGLLLVPEQCLVPVVTARGIMHHAGMLDGMFFITSAARVSRKGIG